ncbi:MAG: hypothetical protein RL380_1426, partial [Verrucomicrobiota bacterium]
MSPGLDNLRVSNSSVSETISRNGAQPSFDFVLTDGLQQAIKQSQDFLLREQKPEGYWVGELMVDSTLVSDTIAYHHWNG